MSHWQKFITEHLKTQIRNERTRIEHLEALAVKDSWYLEQGRMETLIACCQEHIAAFESALDHFTRCSHAV